MGTYTDQYRVITTAETGEDDAVSVAAIREAAKTVNNMKHFACRHKLLSLTGIPNIVCAPSLSEKVILTPAPFTVPEGYNYFGWKIGNAFSAGYSAGTECIWRFYASSRMYNGPDVFDASYLAPGYTSDSLTSDSAHNHERSIRWKIPIDTNPLIFIVITSQIDDVDATSKITTFDLYPEMI